ncbi:MAG TPA: flagellar assembly protein FliH [Nitrosospira sp.]
MSSRIIPKERLFSYQRWQMDAFEPEQPLAPQLAGEEWQHRGGDSAGGAGIDQAGAQSAGEQIEQARQQAKLEGYAAGLEAGHESGYQAGHDAGYQAGYQSGNEQARAEASQLEALLHGFQKELAVADQTIGNDLLMLALGLARQMTREALRLKPELVLAVVRECLQQESAFGQPAQLFLHPEDAVLVRQRLDQELDGWTIGVDPHIERGGCKIKVGHSDADATVAVRWQRITQALGYSGHWLE